METDDSSNEMYFGHYMVSFCLLQFRVCFVLMIFSCVWSLVVLRDHLKCCVPFIAPLGSHSQTWQDSWAGEAREAQTDSIPHAHQPGTDGVCVSYFSHVAGDSLHCCCGDRRQEEDDLKELPSPTEAPWEATTCGWGFVQGKGCVCVHVHMISSGHNVRPLAKLTWHIFILMDT